jgi:hypothetical protein
MHLKLKLPDGDRISGNLGNVDTVRCKTVTCIWVTVTLVTVTVFGSW